MLKPNLIHAEITTEPYRGTNVFISRIPFQASTTDKFSFQFQRKQFLIGVCFAMTINKVQGQTLSLLIYPSLFQCSRMVCFFISCSKSWKSEVLNKTAYYYQLYKKYCFLWSSEKSPMLVLQKLLYFYLLIQTYLTSMRL